MTQSDQAILEGIKRKIAGDANLQETAKWSQKDFDFLSYFIEEKTACRLSVSTLKRIWSNDYQRLPHISTLDALSKTAFDKNWQRLKSASLSNQVEKKDRTFKSTFLGQKKKFKKVAVALLVVIPMFLMLIVGAEAFQKKQKRKEVMANVTFNHEKTFKNKLPNTVVFNYDIEHINADSFFLQQSWDTFRKVEIFKGIKQRTDIYYIPGYFTAKLFADDKIVKEMPVHVIYEDWFMAARQPMSNIVTFDKNLWLRENYLGIATETLGIKGIDINKEFQLAYYYVKDFEVDGDNLTYKTSFKMEPLESVDCPMANFHLQGTEGYYWIMIGNKGCGSEVYIRTGDTLHNGKTQDLTKLTTNIYQWNEVEINTSNKNVQLILNGTEVFSTSYEDSIGGIMEISYFFNGMGMVDDVELADRQGKVKFFDDLEYLNPRKRKKKAYH
ncbi:hypothetical protein [Croceitalea rosinachiae]|uniref:Uncharacterized protein n=1 Tax=Croceitalea rosinachiae TaxID=3075596 RepID=A0ABU3ADY6_9FLAO|nr:hypothetical protein [Croceitalea sp. F388]MDT0608133.1 hypothetical protein [Croceitalea sp. F388]